jgi:hypothetical protein
MSHWRDRLREADGAQTSELPADDVQRLRRTVVAAAMVAHSHRWPLPFALTVGSLAAASAALVLSVAIAGPEPQATESGDRTAAAGKSAAAEMVPEAPLADSGRRQLHFATPGGTRIIWVFDAEFEVKGTLP